MQSKLRSAALLLKRSEIMKKECESDEKNCKIKCLLILILFILLMLGIVIGKTTADREKNTESVLENSAPSENYGGVDMIIDSNTNDYQSSKESIDKEQGVSISGRGAITIPANEKEILVDFYNPKENSGLYYLAFELRLYNKSGTKFEVLYTSDLVEPGRHINHITLTHGLEKGVYDAVVHVQPYRMNEEKALTNNADMKTKLIVG